MFGAEGLPGLSLPFTGLGVPYMFGPQVVARVFTAGLARLRSTTLVRLVGDFGHFTGVLTTLTAWLEHLHMGEDTKTHCVLVWNMNGFDEEHEVWLRSCSQPEFPFTINSLRSQHVQARPRIQLVLKH